MIQKKSFFQIYFEYFLFLIFRYLLIIIPRKMSFIIIYYFIKIFYPHLKVISNEQICLFFEKDLSISEIKEIQRDFFHHIIHLLIEFLIFDKIFLKKEIWKEKIVYSKNQVKRLKKNKKKGFIFVSFHYGNWELLALLIHHIFGDFGFVYRPLDNPLLEIFFKNLREKYTDFLISKFEIYPKVFKILEEGKNLGLLIDQYETRKPMNILFLNSSIMISKGIEIIRAKSKAKIIFCYIRRLNENKYRAYFEEIKIKGEYNSKNLKTIFSKFEKLISKYPDQWLWLQRIIRKSK